MKTKDLKVAVAVLVAMTIVALTMAILVSKKPACHELDTQIERDLCYTREELNCILENDFVSEQDLCRLKLKYERINNNG